MKNLIVLLAVLPDFGGIYGWLILGFMLMALCLALIYMAYYHVRNTW